MHFNACTKKNLFKDFFINQKKKSSAWYKYTNALSRDSSLKSVYPVLSHREHMAEKLLLQSFQAVHVQSIPFTHQTV